MVKENMPIQSKKKQKKYKIWIWIPGMIVVIALAGVIGYIFQDIKSGEMETQETDVTIGCGLYYHLSKLSVEFTNVQEAAPAERVCGYRR